MFFILYHWILQYSRRQKKYRSPLQSHPLFSHKYPPFRKLKSLAESITKGIQAKGSDGAEHHGHGLAELDGAGGRGAAEDDGGEEAELDAVGLVVLDAVAAEAVCFAREVVSVGFVLRDGRWVVGRGARFVEAS